MIKDPRKTPFPYFGGKSDAADLVWRALGDVSSYVEPFAGSLAVLLRRPHQANRGYYSEIVNDLDGMLVNAWRAIQMSPHETADACSWPVSEVDLTARHIALVRWRESGGLAQLQSDPDWHDAKMAGWWIWGLSCWIGGGWCSGDGPWHIGDDGIIRKRERSEEKSPGVSKQLPPLGDNGQGCNSMTTREPGVGDYHPMTMPELLRWFEFLSARLRHVRIIQGDWQRALTGAVVKTLSVRGGKGFAGVFLDPPYSTEADRCMGLYANESGTVAHDVRAWCIENGNDPAVRIVLAGYDTEHAELSDKHGWTMVEWFRSGFLKGGMGNTRKRNEVEDDDGEATHQQKRERLWLSPHCLSSKKAANLSLFGDDT
jgi:hypothetical protein